MHFGSGFLFAIYNEETLLKNALDVHLKRLAALTTRSRLG